MVGADGDGGGGSSGQHEADGGAAEGRSARPQVHSGGCQRGQGIHRYSRRRDGPPELADVAICAALAALAEQQRQMSLAL